MSAYDLTHLRDDALLRDLDTLAAQDRTTTANLLAHIAEVDARRLYAPAGYSSMHAYCVEKLRLSDDSAWKRLQVARPARRFPQILDALAAGRIHLSGLVVLAPHLAADNVDDLLAAAAGRRKSEIEVLVARRFPQVEVMRLDEGIAALPTTAPIASDEIPAPGQTNRHCPVPRPSVAPIAAQRFAVEFTMDQETHDLLRQAQALLGHALPSGDVAEIFRRALELLVAGLEKQKMAKTDKPRRPQPIRNERTIPAEVRRKVWERDGGRCTLVGDDGHRCTAVRMLEFDHVIPVAHGGKSTVDNVRLRCRTHNQLEADRVFGKAFMDAKRGSPSMN